MKHFWQWPIASYLFLGGLGGGMLFLVGVLRLGLGFSGFATIGGVFWALVALAFGCFLLVFELGQPPKAIRVVISATAIIKWGAVLLSIALIAGFIYAIFYVDFLCFPLGLGAMYGDASAPVSNIWLGIASVFGLAVCVYTGVLLSSMKARPFWNTPALPVLFVVSAVSTGSALLALTMCTWPLAPDAATPLVTASGALQHEWLHGLDSTLVLIELLVLFLYLLLMATSSNVTAQKVAKRWLKGSFAIPFWGGMVACGLVIPYFMYQSTGVMSTTVGPILVLLAGLLLRFMIVYSDDRRMLPGEEKYYKHLPKGDEEFLNVWEQGKNLY